MDISKVNCEMLSLYRRKDYSIIINVWYTVQLALEAKHV